MQACLNIFLVLAVLPTESLQHFVYHLGHIAGEGIEGREQLFALSTKYLVVVLELGDRPAELLLVSFECGLEVLEPLHSLQPRSEEALTLVEPTGNILSGV